MNMHFINTVKKKYALEYECAYFKHKERICMPEICGTFLKKHQG